METLTTNIYQNIGNQNAMQTVATIIPNESWLEKSSTVT